jgi:hypothetical protein
VFSVGPRDVTAEELFGWVLSAQLSDAIIEGLLQEMLSTRVLTDILYLK